MEQGGVIQWMGGLWRDVHGWVFPCTCALCGEGPLDGTCLCSACRASLPMVEAPICPRCGEPLPGSVGELANCPYCGGSKVHYDFARSSCLNRDSLRTLVYDFKYGGKIHLAGTLAGLVDGLWELCDDRLAGEDWILVPIPLHRRKLRKRGYNQAEELARVLARSRQLPVLDVLMRARDSVSQASLGRSERIRHVQGLYHVRPSALRRELVKDRSVLLIDDIMTTGSTVDVCARVLKREGHARRVGVLTVARTVNT